KFIARFTLVDRQKHVRSLQHHPMVGLANAANVASKKIPLLVDEFDDEIGIANGLGFACNDGDQIVERLVAIEQSQRILSRLDAAFDVADKPRAGAKINDDEKREHRRDEKQRERCRKT